MKINNDYKYINPDSQEIKDFAEKMAKDTDSLEEICMNIKEYFDQNIEYNRLDAPYFPLQRNDMDTLKLKSGTCGDYSNLVVSTLINLGYDARYAYISTDSYGDSQDHICAAVVDDSKDILIDMTYPYRKWNHFDTQHEEYAIYFPDDFERLMKEEEKFWYEKALEFGDKNYAGLLYAPWIHNEIIKEDEKTCSSLLYLLMMNDSADYSLLLYYYNYSQDKSDLPFLIAVDKEDNINIRISLDEEADIYDDKKFSPFYRIDQVPKEIYNPDIDLVLKDFEKKKEIIKNIIP